MIDAAPASPELKAFIKTLVERADRLKKDRVNSSVDNMLKITGEGRKAALDMRLVELDSEPTTEMKVDRVVARIGRKHGRSGAWFLKDSLTKLVVSYLEG